MGTLLLHILFVSVGAAVGGIAGWLFRSASPQKLLDSANLERLDEYPSGTVEGSFEHVDTMMSRLHQLTASVAADVGEHSNRVQEINDDLNKGGDVVLVVERLMKANHQMQSQLQAAEQRMQQQSREIEAHCKDARTDALTKLANRRAFDDEMRQCIEALNSRGRPTCMMMIDVDHFKAFNDTYGHQAGDEVLRNVARVLRRESAAEEIVCRYGGEEFVVIYPGLDAQTAVPRAERTRAAIALEVVEYQGLDLRVAASAGLAQLQARESCEDLIGRADEALYVCKENGRNCGYWQNGTASMPMKDFIPQIQVAGNAPVKVLALPPAIPNLQASSAAPRPNIAREPEDDLTDLEEQVFKFSDEIATPKIQRRDRIPGLSDYAAFCRDIDRRLAGFRREGGTASLLLVAIDAGEHLAEAYGQKTLDVALWNTAQVVKATKREMDHAARCNYRVFALLLPGASAVEADLIADRIRTEIENNSLPVDGDQVRFTVSVGVTELSSNDERELVIKRANQSLEAAQKAGGNRIMSVLADGSAPLLVATK